MERFWAVSVVGGSCTRLLSFYWVKAGPGEIEDSEVLNTVKFKKEELEVDTLLKALIERLKLGWPSYQSTNNFG